MLKVWVYTSLLYREIFLSLFRPTFSSFIYKISDDFFNFSVLSSTNILNKEQGA